MKALIVGGTGPARPVLANGLIERGYKVTIFHRGTHEIPEIVPEVAHIHGDPHFRERIEGAFGDHTFDVVIAIYGRMRFVAAALALVVFALFLLALRSSPPEPRGVHEAHNSWKHQQPTQASPSPSAIPLRPIAPQISQAPSTPGSDNAEYDSQKRNKWDAIAPPTWSNWMLAVFAVVAAIIGLRTLGKIRDQTKAAVVALRINRVAASAARRSADTLKGRWSIWSALGYLSTLYDSRVFNEVNH